MSYPPALVLVFLLASCQTAPSPPSPVSPSEPQTTASTADSTVAPVIDADFSQEWLWTVLSAKRGRAGELRGTGNQTSAALAVRDMCTTVWEDLDPNHYKKPEPKK